MGFDPKAIAASIMRGYVTDTPSLEEMLYVKGKVAIVTGGTSGLGFCTAQRLLQGGAKVVISGSTEEKGNNAVALLKEAGFPEVTFCKADLCSDRVDSLGCLFEKKGDAARVQRISQASQLAWQPSAAHLSL